MDQDVLFWRQLILKQLNTLLSASPSYTSEQTQKHLDNVDKCVLQAGALGPRPTSAMASWKSYVTDDHSPLEYSLSIKKSACTVRFTFEPLSAVSGTPKDPVNHLAPSQWLHQYKSEHDNLCWYHILSDHLISTSSKHTHLHQSACGLTQYLFGFYLVEKPVLKSYIIHDALARQTSASPAEWARSKDEMLCGAMRAIGLGARWAKVVTYLERLRADNPKYAGWVIREKIAGRIYTAERSVSTTPSNFSFVQLRVRVIQQTTGKWSVIAR
jgi:DMATS type aromatic prenyltransferase